MRPAGFAAALLAALALACSGAEEPAPPPETTPAAADPAPVPALAPGEARVEVSSDGVTVLAHQAPRLVVLMELAAVAGFAAEPGVGQPAARSLTLELRDVSVEDALSAILDGVPHHRHYDFASELDSVPEPWAGGTTALRRVTVGRLAAGAGAPLARQEPPEPEPPPAYGPPPRRSPASLSNEEREREIEASWQHGDPSRRAEAAALMHPEDEDLPRLRALLADDPDPLVRAAAAEVLADGEGFETAPALVDALSDPDPRVVAAAVAALEDLFDDHPDPNIRARVAELREHPDPDVREAVASFEEWVEE